ncbi:MAG: hypothetical protein CFE45_07380 [Burkholderiales bacterium PBB5]|nr:MAG: hypothetical protein CFE45_07380 [Burkholderiales bacterium PBB5]
MDRCSTGSGQARAGSAAETFMNAACSRFWAHRCADIHQAVACGDTGLSRQYSLCGDPAQADVYEIAVLRDPASRGGSLWLHQHAQPGAVLPVRGPRNHFPLEAPAQHLVLVAGGIGITPISAMARQAQAQGLAYSLHYCGSQRAHMPYLAELQAHHGAALQLHVSAEGSRLDVAALLATPQPGTLIYACGPQRLLQALADATAHWPDDSLRVEHFHASAATAAQPGDTAFEVELQHSGRVITVGATQSLLAALRGAGLTIASDCQEGLCGSCQLGVVDGAIQHRDQVLTRAERAAGSAIISCCSRAASGRLVLEL